MATPAILYGFWSSSCSWRVRAVLKMKSIPFEERNLDIVSRKQQLTDHFRSINPAQKVPALEIDGHTLVESMAIIQYLEDIKPDPPLMPATPLLRARAREICEIIVSGIQPLQNVGLRSQFATEDQYIQFSKYWCDRGLQILEHLLGRSSGAYCIGDNLTLADVCLLPQLYNAVTRHKLHITKYPTVNKLYEKLLREPVFKETHPMRVRETIKSKV